jgi:hypothetical protein
MILPTTKHSRNIHDITCQSGQEFLLISDLHWDNPHCDRGLLTNHLKEAQRRNAGVIVNGDFFCLMQGKGDPRRSKEDIREEHNNARYLDSIVNTAVEWFAPYAKNLLLVGYGNHETSIIHHQETDILQRFASTLNYATGSAVEVGGYGGTIDIRVQHDPRRGWTCHQGGHPRPTPTRKQRRLRPHMDGPCPRIVLPPKHDSQI